MQAFQTWHSAVQDAQGVAKEQRALAHAAHVLLSKGFTALRDVKDYRAAKRAKVSAASRHAAKQLAKRGFAGWMQALAYT